MANNRAYGLDNALQTLAPRPVVSQRAPLTTDRLEIGQTWVDVPNQAVYVLVAVANNAAVWTTSPASGVGAFTAVTVNPGDIDVTAGDVNIDAGNLAVTAGNATIGGDLTVAGTTTLNGDIDFASAALIDLTSTLNAAPSILLEANGGTSEQIQLRANQGTSLTSLYLLSDVGGIKIYAPGFANDASIDIQSDLGGIDMDAALSITITSTENTADSIVISSTNGGIDITATGAAAGEDIDISASSSINLTSSEAVTSAIVLTASNAAGGIALSAGTGSISSTTTGDFNVFSTNNAAAAIYLETDAGTTETIVLNCKQGTGAASIELVSVAGGVSLTSGLASDDAINLAAAAGGVDVDAALSINIDSAQAAATAVVIQASNAAGGMDLTCGTAGMDLTATGGDVNITSTNNAADAIYLRANAGTSETIRLHADQGTGVASIGLVSDVGGITLTATGLASDDAINLSAVAGGVDIDGALQVNIASSEAAADAIVITASNAGSGIDITCGTGGMDLTATGGDVNITSTNNAADAIYLRANGGTGEKIRLHADQGTAADSIELESDAGGITLTSPAAFGFIVNNGTQAAGIYVGTGSPNTALTAAQGSIFLRVDGSSTSTRLYVNTDGATGWTNFTSAA